MRRSSLNFTILGLAMFFMALGLWQDESAFAQEGNLLRIGQQRGTLAQGDARLRRGNRDNIYYDLYHFDVARGSRVTIEMSSGNIDCYLQIFGDWPFRNQIAFNDDSGGRRDSRIETTIRNPGTYYLVASSFDSWDAGTYTLTYSVRGPAGGGDAVISCKQVLNGSLTANDNRFVDTGGYYDIITFEGVINQPVVIDLTSNAFDTVMSLYFNQFTGDALVTNDDVARGNRNSRISLRLPHTGVYKIVAYSYRPGTTGAYKVALDCDRPDVEEGRVLLWNRGINSRLDAGDPHFQNERGHYEIYRFEGRAGQQATIDMTSRDVDCYLYLYFGRWNENFHIPSN